MKKIVGLTLAIVLIIGMVAGGTWAYFTDTEEIINNTFTAGTIDLSLDPTTGQAVKTADGVFDDLKPCQTGYITVTLTNSGGNEMDVWKMITSVVCTGGTSTDAEEAETANDAIDEVIIYDMWIEVGGNLEYNVGDTMIVDEVTGLHIDDIDEFYIYLGTLASGASMDIVQSYHMQADTGNWAQGDVMTFTMKFFAQQNVGDAPAPTPELTGYGKADWPTP